MTDKKGFDQSTFFAWILAIVFITLKLCGVINWHWVWVVSPLWMPLVFAFCICVLLLMAVGFLEFAGCIHKKARQRLRKTEGATKCTN